MQAITPAQAVTQAKPTIKAAHERVGLNMLSNWASLIVGLVIAFFLAPYMVHKLGDSKYGIWAFSLQLASYLGVLDFGLRIALTRYFTHYHAREEYHHVRDAVSVGLSILAFIGLLSLLITLVLVYFLPHWIKVPPELHSTARIVFFLIGLQIAIAFPGNLFGAMLAAVSRYDLLNFTLMLNPILGGLLVWLALSHGLGLVSVALIALISSGVNYLLNFFLARRLYGGIRFRMTLQQLQTHIRPLLTFSAFAFLLSVSGRLVLWSDNIVVGFVLGPAIVTYYAIGGNLVDAMQKLLGSSTMVFVPMATSFNARSEGERLRMLLLKGSRFTFLLLLPGIIGFLILGRSFIGLWMGPRYVQLSGAVLILLSLTLVFAPLRGTCHQILYGMNRHRFNAYASLIEAFINLLLSIFLAYKIGAVGVAWGTMIPSLIFSGLVIPLYTTRHVGISWSKLCLESWLIPAVSSLPFAVLLMISVRLGIPSTWGGFWATVICSLLFYVAFAWFVVFSKSEKETVYNQIRTTRERLGFNAQSA
jgi:O-antigen/teichoic acid export membrane protein